MPLTIVFAIEASPPVELNGDFVEIQSYMWIIHHWYVLYVNVKPAQTSSSKKTTYVHVHGRKIALVTRGSSENVGNQNIACRVYMMNISIYLQIVLVDWDYHHAFCFDTSQNAHQTFQSLSATLFSGTVQQQNASQYLNLTCFAFP